MPGPGTKPRGTKWGSPIWGGSFELGLASLGSFFGIPLKVPGRSGFPLAQGRMCMYMLWLCSLVADTASLRQVVSPGL